MFTPDPAVFEVQRATVRDGVELAFWREGIGGTPLLLLHGWPETKRIWLRNVRPLAAAGFEVIVPDLRGFGDSGLAPDGCYDTAAHALDAAALVRDVLGHASCIVAGGDLGGGVAIDLGLRFPGFVRAACVFNSILPILPDEYGAAGIDPGVSIEMRQAADYFVRQGREADALASELSTAELRRRYVAQFYGPRFWATPGAFRREDVELMTEPFADPERLRAGFGNYESALGVIPLSEAPRLFEVSPVPTLLLYGPDDHVLWRDWPARAEVAFAERVGPFVVPRAGHFLQWERAELFNAALAAFVHGLPGARP